VEGNDHPSIDVSYSRKENRVTLPARLFSILIVPLGLLATASAGAQQPVKPGPPDKDARREFTATPSGLKYRILRKSEGPKPTADQAVQVHYRGWLPDSGQEFDSSYTRGEPIVFPLGGVIPGWTEGLQLVSKGGMIELEIPPQLAYGAQGAGNAIPPNATLRFLVELLDIVAPGPRDENAPAEFSTTPSGLKYRILRKSSGEKPQATSSVRVHYRGWLPDPQTPDRGRAFDSSYARGEPIAFPLSGVIPGWTEGLQLIGEGGMIELEIPPQLAYGARGAGDAIPPNSTLRFLVELLEVDPPQR
jgi:FKBP-type peptidyl-prolyl cis-trans isomerase